MDVSRMTKTNSNGKNALIMKKGAQPAIDQSSFTAKYISDEAQWLQSLASDGNLNQLSYLLGLVVSEAESVSENSRIIQECSMDISDRKPKRI